MVYRNLGGEVKPNQRNSEGCFCAVRAELCCIQQPQTHWATLQSLETPLLLTEECDIDYKTLMLRDGERGRQGSYVVLLSVDYGGQLLVKLSAVNSAVACFGIQQSMVSLHRFRSLAPQMHFKIHIQNWCFFCCRLLSFRKPDYIQENVLLMLVEQWSWYLTRASPSNKNKQRQGIVLTDLLLGILIKSIMMGHTERLTYLILYFS